MASSSSISMMNSGSKRRCLMLLLLAVLATAASADVGGHGSLQHLQQRRMVHQNIKARQNNEGSLAMTRGAVTATPVAAVSSSSNAAAVAASPSPSASSPASSSNNNNNNNNGQQGQASSSQAAAQQQQQQQQSSQQGSSQAAAQNNPSSASVAAPSSSAQSAASSSSSNEGLLGGLNSGVSQALDPSSASSSSSSSSSAAAAVSSSSSAAATSSAAPASSSAAAQTSAAVNVVSTSLDAAGDVENITLTSTVSAPTTSASIDAAAAEAASASAVAASEAAAKKAEEDDSSSGIGKKTIIIIIVVASVVGGAIAIWTIVRKIKLSPSSRFNRKLAPIDFGVGRRDSDFFDGSQVDFSAGAGAGGNTLNGKSGGTGGEAWPLHRSPSQSSNGHGSVSGHGDGSLRRQPSSGTMLGAGGRRSDSVDGDAGRMMSEVGGGGHGPAFYPSMPPQAAMSHHGSGDFNAMGYQQNYGGANEDFYGQQQQGVGGLNYGQSMRRPNY